MSGWQKDLRDGVGIGAPEKKDKSASLAKVKPAPNDLGISDLEFVDTVKKIDPKKLQKTKDMFESTIKPILIGPGGIKETMAEITDSFADVDVTAFESIADMTLNIASIPRALAIVQEEGAKVSKEEFLNQTMALVDAARGGFKYVNETFREGGLNLDSETKEGLVKTVDDAKVMTQSLGSIGSVGEAFTSLGEDLTMFTGRGAAAKYPVVQAITKMVAAANHINGELASLPEINLKPKLLNLGKALGLHGIDGFTLKREDFSVNVVVDVELSPTKLANAMVDTGKVMKSSKVS
jgi:hypothetical protein